MDHIPGLMILMAAGLLLGVVAGCSDSAGPGKAPPNPVEKPAASISEPAASSADAKSPTAAASGEITLTVAGPEEYQALLDKHNGKVVLVDFWATYCAPCRKQFPHTVELSRKHAAAGFVAISVSCDEPEKEGEALAFLKKSNATFENLRSKFGGDEETFTTFSIEGGALPHYKLYDRAGKLRQTFGTDPTAEKQFTSEEIDAAVTELLAEKE